MWGFGVGFVGLLRFALDLFVVLGVPGFGGFDWWSGLFAIGGMLCLMVLVVFSLLDVLVFVVSVNSVALGYRRCILWLAGAII